MIKTIICSIFILFAYSNLIGTAQSSTQIPKNSATIQLNNGKLTLSAGGINVQAGNSVNFNNQIQSNLNSYLQSANLEVFAPLKNYSSDQACNQLIIFLTKNFAQVYQSFRLIEVLFASQTQSYKFRLQYIKNQLSYPLVICLKFTHNGNQYQLSQSKYESLPFGIQKFAGTQINLNLFQKDNIQTNLVNLIRKNNNFRTTLILKHLLRSQPYYRAIFADGIQKITVTVLYNYFLTFIQNQSIATQKIHINTLNQSPHILPNIQQTGNLIGNIISTVNPQPQPSQSSQLSSSQIPISPQHPPGNPSSQFPQPTQPQKVPPITPQPPQPPQHPQGNPSSQLPQPTQPQKVPPITPQSPQPPQPPQPPQRNPSSQSPPFRQSQQRPLPQSRKKQSKKHKNYHKSKRNHRHYKNEGHQHRRCKHRQNR